MDGQPSSEASAPTRGRGRGKSRGGLGKYLRARGRGRGRGRPAQFTTRLVLEDEQEVELDEEELKEMQQKYSRRQLGTNADRYAEPEPELGSDGASLDFEQLCLVKSFIHRRGAYRRARGRPLVVSGEATSRKSWPVFGTTSARGLRRYRRQHRSRTRREVGTEHPERTCAAD